MSSSNVWSNYDYLEQNIEVRMILDSLRESNGTRVSTMLWRVPRFLLPQLNTYRTFSRNVSSCLTGDNELYFDKPVAIAKGKRFLNKVSLDTLYRKWTYGNSIGRTQKHVVRALCLRCYDFDKNEFKHTHIRDIRYEGLKEVYKVTFSNKFTLTLTSDHRLLTTEGWKTLQDYGLHVKADGQCEWNEGPKIAANEKLTKPSGPHPRWVRIRNIEYVGVEKVYDVEVEDENESFVCNGIVVHNSRAKRFSKTVSEVLDNPYVPYIWQADHAGMQTEERLEAWKTPIANFLWNASIQTQTFWAGCLSRLGVSKQYTNRLIEPYMYVDYLVTANDFDNFLTQRDSFHAQLEIQVLARRLRLALECSEPTVLKTNEWHLPFVTNSEKENMFDAIRLSVARCARTSYLAPNIETDKQADFKLFARLAKDYHLSPFEHQVVMSGTWGGNLQGVTQLRKVLETHLTFTDGVFNLKEFENLLMNRLSLFD